MNTHRAAGSILLALAAAAIAQDRAMVRESTAITIYSSGLPGGVPPELYRPLPANPYSYTPFTTIPGFAVVRHDRPMTLGTGRSHVRFTDVAALLDPTTVRFESLDDPAGTKVLEQDYRFDLVSPQKLLEAYIGKTVTIERYASNKHEEITGTLLSASGGTAILQEAGGTLRTLTGFSGVRYPALPEGLLTRPTLMWEVQSGKPGLHRTRVSYQTDGITWWADYNVVFREGSSANAGEVDVGAWVSIVNRSGASYDDAALKLVAGDVQRLERGDPRFDALGSNRSRSAPMGGEMGFAQKAFFEYHLYTLSTPVDLPDNSTKQLELFPAARNIPAEKIMVYDGLADTLAHAPGSPLMDSGIGMGSNTKVDVFLRFRNSKAHGLGIPLPTGRVRVSKADEADGSLEFIGEDATDHTPREEWVRIALGQAFDVVGERTRETFEVDNRARWMQEKITVKVRNQKDQPVDVVVKERLFRWVNWSITEASDPHERVDAGTIHFPVRIEPGEEKIVTYVVRYTW